MYGVMSAQQRMYKDFQLETVELAIFRTGKLNYIFLQSIFTDPTIIFL